MVSRQGIYRSCAAQLYWSNPQQPWRYVSVAEFAEHFKKFSAGREIALRLATPPPPTPLPAKHSASGHEEVRCVKENLRSLFFRTGWLLSACGADKSHRSRTTEGCLALQVLVRSKFALSPRQLFSACLEVRPGSLFFLNSVLE